MLCDNCVPRGLRVRLASIPVLLLAWLVASAGVAQANELVVDNASAAVQVTGSGWHANSTSPGFYGGDYLFHVPGDGASRVNWQFPPTGTPGTYAVFARWSSGPNRADPATYVVASSTATTEVRMNQRTGGGQWQLLVSYTFQPDRNQGVTLSDHADGVVIADAIVWVGPAKAGDGTVRPQDVAAAREQQRSVDAGDQPWRLDPLQAAQADAIGLGLAASDSFHVVSVEAGTARVRVRDRGVDYDIHLVQPARLGATGIWVVERISPTPR
jgi:hypothetical protein